MYQKHVVPFATVSFLLVAILLGYPSGDSWGDELAPVASGGVIDNFPKDGLGDELDDVAFIINRTQSQHRAIVEYDLSTIPPGTILSASLTGWVGANNSLDRGPREHLVEVYTGNGLVDLGDYDVPGIEVGRFMHDAGDSTDFDFDIRGILHNLLATGADALGMRISPLSADLPPDVLSTNEHFDPPRLYFEMLPLGAETVQLAPHFDASVERDGDVYQLVEGEVSVGAQRIDFADIDRRAILEYDISAIPVGADITGAEIEFDIRSFSGGQEDGPDAPLYGYSGDGLAEVVDAFHATQQIGTLSVRDTEATTVDLDHEYIESLLGTTEFFGLAVHGDPDFDGLSFASLEFGEPPFFIPPASLTLTYVLPALEGDYNADGAVDAADYTVWRDTYGQAVAIRSGADGDGDGAIGEGDYATWKANFGSLASGAGSADSSSVSAPVPEPSIPAMLVTVLGVASLGARFNATRGRRSSAVPLR